MQIVFHKVDNGRLCGWLAAPPNRKRFQGTTMASGRDLPHDLAQFVVEATLSLQHGFWGLLANGATFKSVPGRRRTQQGRQLIRAHREVLFATEHLVNAHVTAWRTGTSTPVRPALDAMLVRWRALRIGEELRVDWLTQPLVPHNQQCQPAVSLFATRSQQGVTANRGEHGSGVEECDLL
jgi:hypothetical protein